LAERRCTVCGGTFVAPPSKAMGGDRVKSTEGGTSSSKSSSEGRLGDHTTKPRAGK